MQGYAANCENTAKSKELGLLENCGKVVATSEEVLERIKRFTGRTEDKVACKDGLIILNPLDKASDMLNTINSNLIKINVLINDELENKI